MAAPGIFREEIRRLCAGFCPNHTTQTASGGILCIDPNVFRGQVAGQEFTGCMSHVQINPNMYRSLQHGFMNFILVEVLRGATVAAHRQMPDPDRCATGIDGRTRVAGGSEDSAPIGITAGERGFHQRGIRDTARDALGVFCRGCAFDRQFNHVASAFSIFDDLAR